MSNTPELEYFTLHDSKVGVYREPMLAINRHDILRQLTDLFKDPEQQKAQIVANAEDFALFKCGEFSKVTGKMTGTPLEHIANLHDIRSAVARSNLRNPEKMTRDVTQSSGTVQELRQEAGLN